MNMYPPEVTLFDDGVYRWSYDMDMWHNTFMLHLVLKILAVFFAIPVLFFLGMLLRRIFPVLLHRGMHRIPLRILGHFLRSDGMPLLIALLVFGCAVGLTLLIYAISALVMHGNYHLCFEMNDTAVALVRSAKATKTMRTLTVVATIAGLAAGKPGEAMRTNAAMLAADAAATSRFSSIRHVRQFPADDVINLHEIFSMNQIYVNHKDYPFVLDYILARVREKARS